MNDRIIHFLQQQSCATICSVDHEGNPYCFNCFYSFDEESGLMYFKSSSDTYHTSLIKNNPVVAGTILPDKLNKMHTQGIQLQGEILSSQHRLAQEAFKRYHKKYPMALAMAGDVYTVQLNHIKFTDSSLGFGKKITWERPQQESVK